MLKLALPSKGRLRDKAVETFAEAGVQIRPAGTDREYAAETDLPGIEPVLLSAGEIPGALGAGEIHVGVTGVDLIRERVADVSMVTTPLKLGFGHADLVVAVPACWADVETMHDLDEAAADFRARHGRPMRVATKYHRLTREFFGRMGVADYRLIDSQGATEAGPRHLTCELIVDITSSGETLRANHLKILDDGLILRSEAALCVSRAARWDGDALKALFTLAARMGFDAGLARIPLWES